MNQKLIRFEDVSMEFKDKGQSFKALDGISFSINPGDVLGIIGESGSGKSTIAKLLSGLHKPSQGKIFFEDKEISHLSRKDKKWLHTQVQMVFQNAQGSFNPRRTIGHSIEETVCQLCAHTK
ncbi:MAG TPA: ATP-binding cassette domain-containing protein, partial [Lachnospiraceae bacterium]